MRPGIKHYSQRPAGTAPAGRGKAMTGFTHLANASPPPRSVPVA